MAHNIFLVETPLQLLNCIELIKKLGFQDNAVLCIVTDSRARLKQIIKISHLIKWKEKHLFLNSYNQKRNTFYRLIISPIILTCHLRRMKKQLLKYEQVNTCTFSKYGKNIKEISPIVFLFFEIIKKYSPQVYIVDDGTLSVLNQSNHTTIEPSVKFRVYYRLMGYTYQKIDYKVFTAFKSCYAECDVIENHYKYLKGLKQQKIASSTPKKALIIGRPLIELGLLMNPELEFKAMQTILNYLKIEKGIDQVDYYPHIDENIEKCKRYYRILNIKALTNKDCAEWFFLNTHENYTVICSLGSSASITLRDIFGIESICFSLPINAIAEIHQGSTQAVYQFFAKNMSFIELS